MLFLRCMSSVTLQAEQKRKPLCACSVPAGNCRTRFCAEMCFAFLDFLSLIAAPPAAPEMAPRAVPSALAWGCLTGCRLPRMRHYGTRPERAQLAQQQAAAHAPCLLSPSGPWKRMRSSPSVKQQRMRIAVHSRLATEAHAQ